MKTKLLPLAIVLFVVGAVFVGFGYNEYSFSHQTVMDATQMSLEDYKDGQRIETELFYAYGSYAETQSYNTFMGIKTTKGETTDQYYLVPMLTQNEEGEIFIDYLVTFIVPANMIEDFETMTLNFWTNPGDDFSVKFPGKVTKMTSEIKGFLKEYFEADYDSENDPGVSEYDYLLTDKWFANATTPADIDARCVNYCISFNKASETTALIMLGCGAAGILIGVILFVISLKKKKEPVQDEFY